MPKPKINDTKLLHLIDKEKLNQPQAAKVLDRKIDAIGQLQKINSDANAKKPLPE